MQHGEWQTYRTGCRCVLCRAANAAYAHRPAVGTVDASDVRRHLLELAAQGIGSASVARLARVSRWTVRRVRAGTATRLRPATAMRLRQVAPVLALGSLIASTRTHRFLDSLVREGFTHRAIAVRLGCHCQQLQLNTNTVPSRRRRPTRPPTPHRVRVSTARRVEALYNAVAAENPA